MATHSLVLTSRHCRLWLPCAASRPRSLSCAAASHPPPSRVPRNLKPVKNPNKRWDEFYKRHHDKFFKDRHYLEKDWGHYFSLPSDGSQPPADHKVVLEAHEAFRSDRVNAFVCDVMEDDLCKAIMPASVDVVTMIFMLSAVSPMKMPLVLQNIKDVLKPGGYLLFRDYALGDFSQEKLAGKDQIISDNFYVRGDGTCAFFFSEDSLSALFRENGFNPLELGVYSKQIVNRSRKVVMNRRWMRATFCSIDHPDFHEAL